MKLIAKKLCRFGGKQFYIGEEIPTELVLNPQAQEKMGVLVIVDGDAEGCSQPVVISDPTLTICVNIDGSDMELEPTDRGLQDIFNVLIGQPSAAKDIINKMTDEDALILLHLSDSRKAVKAAAEERAKSLRESAGEE